MARTKGASHAPSKKLWVASASSILTQKQPSSQNIPSPSSCSLSEFSTSSTSSSSKSTDIQLLPRLCFICRNVLSNNADIHVDETCAKCRNYETLDYRRSLKPRAKKAFTKENNTSEDFKRLCNR